MRHSWMSTFFGRLPAFCGPRPNAFESTSPPVRTRKPTNGKIGQYSYRRWEPQAADTFLRRVAVLLVSLRWTCDPRLSLIDKKDQQPLGEALRHLCLNP